MTVIEDVCEVALDHTGEKLRCFVRGHPDESTDVLHLREDLERTDHRESEAESELLELVATESYEYTMDADNVNQIIKVADTEFLFTGFVQDAVVIAAFDGASSRCSPRSSTTSGPTRSKTRWISSRWRCSGSVLDADTGRLTVPLHLSTPMKIHARERYHGVVTAGSVLPAPEPPRVRAATYDRSPRRYRRVALDGGGGA
jgi:hypothetical protein